MRVTAHLRWQQLFSHGCVTAHSSQVISFNVYLHAIYVYFLMYLIILEWNINASELKFCTYTSTRRLVVECSCCCLYCCCCCFCCLNFQLLCVYKCANVRVRSTHPLFNFTLHFATNCRTSRWCVVARSSFSLQTCRCECATSELMLHTFFLYFTQHESDEYVCFRRFLRTTDPEILLDFWVKSCPAYCGPLLLFIHFSILLLYIATSKMFSRINNNVIPPSHHIPLLSTRCMRPVRFVSFSVSWSDEHMYIAPVSCVGVVVWRLWRLQRLHLLTFLRLASSIIVWIHIQPHRLLLWLLLFVQRPIMEQYHFRRLSVRP